jgi:hypothetical protein
MASNLVIRFSAEHASPACELLSVLPNRASVSRKIDRPKNGLTV